MQEQELVTVTVGGPPSREIKRQGRWYMSGTKLEISRAEYDKAPPGMYVLPGEPDHAEKAVVEQKKVQDAAERAEKLRRMEEDQKRREEAAARNAKLLEEQAQLARAGAARLVANNKARRAG